MKSIGVSLSWVKRLIGGLASLALILLLSVPPCLAGALTTEPPQVAFSVTHRQGLSDPQELEAFLDNFFAQQMANLHIPGVTFTLVKDGKVFFTKGYGYADLEKKVAVDPDKTLFRLASVSKLFATTAVMQLAEKGQLNLHDDVNKYLKRFQLQENYPAPVTFDNLLTHTGGFDESFIGLAARNPAEILPLGDYLAQQMPPRVMPPGKAIAYSNHGIALAGYLVEVISGLPFAQYIDENVLQPLGMHESSFLQPLPPDLAPDLAVGYEYFHGSYQPIPSYYVNDGPAGALKATATDLSHFMIAHLQKGRYGESKILEEKTAIEMHSSHFTHHSRLAGWAYGFSERRQNNLRAIEHGGTDPGFASLLFLLPEQNLGFFVAYNNQQDELREQLVSQFLDRYYPVQQATIPPQAIADSPQRAKYFVGSYRFIRYPRRTLEKLAPVLLKAPISAPELQVKVQRDSSLTLESSSYKSNCSPRRALNKVGSLLQGVSTSASVERAVPKLNQLVEVEPLLFQMSDVTILRTESGGDSAVRT
ncbi:MAG: putative D-alanyl-D-alanine carboxypeptidase [Chroococcidiopsis sp. SAG 2025]|nr:putative D-alanyl-D-alanine carboxypeptidase [Chroococcidiopsis sp. SAG 2025]